MGGQIPERLCGRPLSAADVETIREEIRLADPPIRSEIARRVCRALEWTNALGQPKLMSCRVGLLRLHRAGLIELPAPTGGNGNGRPLKRQPKAWPEEVALGGSVGALSGLRLSPVVDKKASRLWNGLIDRYHYLGYTPLPGAQVRYLIEADAGVLGAIGFGAAAWKVASRDRWIGWEASVREAHLGRVLNNARFLLLPWVQVRNLASKVLALCGAAGGRRTLPRATASDRCCWRPSLRSRAFVAAAIGRPTGGIWARPKGEARAIAPIGRRCRARASTSTLCRRTFAGCWGWRHERAGRGAGRHRSGRRAPEPPGPAGPATTGRQTDGEHSECLWWLERDPRRLPPVRPREGHRREGAGAAQRLYRGASARAPAGAVHPGYQRTRLHRQDGHPGHGAAQLRDPPWAVPASDARRHPGSSVPGGARCLQLGARAG